MLTKNLIAKSFGINDIEFEDEVNVSALYKKNWSIAWPSVLEGALLSFMNSLDTMMVGSIGLNAIASVGLSAQPRMILLLLSQALCVGVTAVIARRKGEDNQKDANTCLKQSLLLMTFLGLLMAFLGVTFAEPFMKLVGANEDTLMMSVTYFRVIAAGMVFNYWSLCICAALKAIGQTKVTLITNMTSNVVNIIFNYLLIGGKFGFPRWGVFGAAVATVLGTFVSCCIAFYFVLRPGGYLRLKIFEKIDTNTDSIKSVLNVGSSSIAESVCLRIGFVINQKLVAGVGTAAYATYYIVQQISSLSFTVGDGLAVASTSLVGQSLGQKRRDLAMAYVRITRNMSLIISLIIMTAVFLSRSLLPRLFTDDPVVIANSAIAFVVIVIGLIPQNGRIVYSGCLRGAGDTRYVAIISLLSVTIVRPLATYVFCYPLNAIFPALLFTITGPWLSFFIDSVLRDTLLKRRIDKGNWLNIRL